MDSRHVFGTHQRIFLNLDLGCASACSYCYLPDQGLDIGRRMQADPVVSAAAVIDTLFRHPAFVPGRDGTIISIGCFSETWDPVNRGETIALINGLAVVGNPIQVATKRRVTEAQLHEVTPNQRWAYQITFFVSTASVSRWQEFESKTEHPIRRFQSLTLDQRFGVGFALYIKPVLPGVTILDLPYYRNLLERSQVPVVVGDRFDSGSSGAISPISDTLFVAENAEMSAIRAELSKIADVYTNSIEVVEKYRSAS